jgi:predicted transcriptional regulator
MTRRIEFIETVLKGPKDKRTLVEDLGVSRSTVDRAARELESLELITYSADGYIPTPVCERAATRFFALTDAIELRRKWKPFLRWMPADEFDLDLALLQDADLLLPEAGNPWAMINRHVQLLKEMDRFRGILPLVGLHAHEASYERIMENGAEGEAVVSQDVVNTLRSNPAYAEKTQEMAATGRYGIYQYEGNIPYALMMIDDTVQIGVDEDGEPRAILETDSAEVRKWADDAYNTYKQQAEEVI